MTRLALVPSLLLIACTAAAPTPPPPPSAPASVAVDESACTRDAVVFLLDRSGSMTGQPFEEAKAGAKRVYAKLGKDDCFGLVTFDSRPARVVRLAPGGESAKIDTAIDMLGPGGGTEFSGALDLAFQDLKAAKNAKRKLVLFLTDGQAPKAGIQPLVESMAAEQMRVSTIGLGSATDPTMLRMIADKTKGHMRLVEAAADLPKNLEEELAALRR